MTIDPQSLLNDASLDRISLRELIVLARSPQIPGPCAIQMECSLPRAVPDEEDAISWEDAEWR